MMQLEEVAATAEQALELVRTHVAFDPAQGLIPGHNWTKATLLLPASYFMATTTAGATDTGKVEISAQHDYYFMDFPDGAAKVYAVTSCPIDT